MSNELAIRPASGALEFTPEQTQLIRDTFANGASDAEFAVLMEVARARRLSPILRQIYFVQRWDGQKKRNVWSTQISIDGLRAVAQRTGVYAGQDEPEYVYDEKSRRLIACKVRVYRADWGNRPSVGVAHFEEYVQKTREGQTTAFWSRMPHVMLAKCAEALGIRKAFPEDTAGLYVPEEMGAGAVIEGQFTDDAPSAGAARSVAGQVTALEAPAQNGALATLNATLAAHGGPVPVERAQEIAREHYPALAAEGDGAIVAGQTAIKGRVAHGGKGKVGDVFAEEGRALAEQRRAATQPARVLNGDTLRELFEKAPSFDALVAGWVEHLPVMRGWAEGDHFDAHSDAVQVANILLGGNDEAAAGKKFDAAVIAATPKPDGDGPKKAAKPRAVAPVADAQGSASEGASAPANTQARAPHPESAPYVADAAAWRARCVRYANAIEARRSWEKHVVAFRAAGVFFARRDVAAQRLMNITGIVDEAVAARVLDDAERAADAAARVRAEAQRTGRSEITVRRQTRERAEKAAARELVEQLPRVAGWR